MNYNQQILLVYELLLHSLVPWAANIWAAGAQRLDSTLGIR